MLKTAVIGVGNMGSKYAAFLYDGKIPGMELSAITRVRGEYRDKLLPAIEKGIPVYESGDALLDATGQGKLALDAVIIATPHPSHEELAVKAFSCGLHVLCDKPAGVYSRQARRMEEAAIRSQKTYGMIFHQRTMPLYKALRDIVRSGRYGALKRVNWVVTDWYRPDSYYRSSAWRASWRGEGGGVMINQCPHNLDLLQWICGMPVRVQAFCRTGHFHDIEVEDDVTAYLEWENGASGTFITSTGDAPGINRLEISLDEAMLVCENGELRIGELEAELGMKEAEYRRSATEMFKKIKGSWTKTEPGLESAPYEVVINNFAAACRGEEPCIAPGAEGRKSLILSNACYLSSWEKRMVELPSAESEEERDFERTFERWLSTFV